MVPLRAVPRRPPPGSKFDVLDTMFNTSESWGNAPENGEDSEGAVDHSDMYSPWSSCSSTCEPAYRSRKRLICAAADELCMEIGPCEIKLPECGSDSYAADVGLVTGEAARLPCPVHPRAPALRLAWFRWGNASWESFYPDGRSRISLRPHTLDLDVQYAGSDNEGSYKCVLLFPDGKVKTARYYHVKVVSYLSAHKRGGLIVGIFIGVLALLLCVCLWCVSGSVRRLLSFHRNPEKKLTELYYQRLKEEGIIKE